MAHDSKAPIDGDIAIRVARSDELDLLIEIDDDASTLFAEGGMPIEFGREHPFVRAEVERWRDALADGRVWVAELGAASPAVVGFASCGLVDGEPFLQQLAVRRRSMQRGIGSRLLREALTWAGAAPMCLTTYAHLAWNAPFYAKHGFAPVPEGSWGVQMRAVVAAERAVLPEPSQRIAMRREASPR